MVSYLDTNKREPKKPVPRGDWIAECEAPAQASASSRETRYCAQVVVEKKKKKGLRVAWYGRKKVRNCEHDLEFRRNAASGNAKVKRNMEGRCAHLGKERRSEVS